MRIAVAGNPNVGKTTLFNALTGRRQEVANWPGTTVDYVTGRVPALAGEPLELIDLPGTYALEAYSQEERVTRNFLLHEPHDAVIVVVDASRLERNLYLALELIELTPRLVLALNMMDAAERDGLRIDAKAMSELLGVPVVPTVASRGTGLRELIAAARVAAHRRDLPVAAAAVPYPEEVRRDLIAPIAARLSALPGLRHPPGWTALQLLQGERDIAAALAVLPQGKSALALARDLLAGWGEPRRADGTAPAVALAEQPDVAGHQEELGLVLADSRYDFIAKILKASVRRRLRWRRDPTERLDGLLLHPFLGYLFMGAIFALGFWLAFVASAPLSGHIDRLLVAMGGATARWLAGAGAPAFLRSLLLSGIFPGVGAVLSFVPYMAVFFAVYEVLQDSGYMARASLLVDRFMQLIGLHGKGFFALVSAYGCNVPALTATRVMENPRDRLLANLVIPFIPCNARLGVMAVMTAAFFPGAAGALAMIGLIALSLLVLTLVTALYRHTLLPSEPAPLVLELPRYHWPSWRTVALAVWHRVWLFLSRIWWFLIWATIAIWALTYFPLGQPIDHSYAALLGRWLTGLAGRHFGFDWRLMIAILFGFVAKETTLSTLGVLYGSGSGYVSLAHALTHALTPLVAFTYLVVYMLYVPCLSTVVQMRRESGAWSWAALGAGVNVAVAFGAGFLVERIGIWLGFAP